MCVGGWGGGSERAGYARRGGGHTDGQTTVMRVRVLKRAHLSPTESTAFETLSSPADNMFFDPTTAGTFSSMTSPLRSATLDAGRLTTLSAPGDMLALLLGSTNPGGFASSRGIARPRGLTVAPPFFGTAAGGKSSPCHSFTFARPAMGC